jgi:hypothetical protein
VHGPRQQLLAAARLPGDQQRRRIPLTGNTVENNVRGLPERADRAALPDDRVER